MGRSAVETVQVPGERTRPTAQLATRDSSRVGERTRLTAQLATRDSSRVLYWGKPVRSWVAISHQIALDRDLNQSKIL